MARRGGSGRSGSKDYVTIRNVHYPERWMRNSYYIDRRRWHPGGKEAWPVVIGDNAGEADRLVVPSRKVVARKARHFERTRNDPFVSWLVGFAVPDFVSVCLRRKERKEVLHAKRKTGKGSGFSFRRRSLLSDIVC